MFDIQRGQKRDATLYTSLPPKIVRTIAGRDVSEAYQKACIFSWRSQGFDVVSVNSRAEIDVLSKVYPDVTFQEIAGDRPRIVDFIHAICQSDQSFAGIINADCMLFGNDGAMLLLLEAAQGGLVLGERFNMCSEDGRVTGVRCLGFDLVFLCKEAVGAFEFDDRITIGTPWWDYWFPLAFQQAGGRLFTLPAPILLHLDHPQNWSQENWFLQGRKAYAGLLSSGATAKVPLPFVRPFSDAQLSDDEVRLFSDNAFSWLKKTSIVLQAEEPSTWVLFSFLAAADRVPRDLSEKFMQIKQLDAEKAATEAALRLVEEKFRQTEEKLGNGVESYSESAGKLTTSDPGFADRRISAPNSVSRTIAVVIPSRLAKRADGKLFLNQAIAAARGQIVPENIHLAFYVGIDADAEVSSDLGSLPGVTFVRSRGRGQSAAINTAAAAAATNNHDFIALLEDDDRWESNFLSWSLSFLDTCDFVSSNQLEIDAEGHSVRVNDFPTPSGWIMSAELWRHIGGFDESLRWHVDNDWLGRLAMSGARRIHLVEATAPITPENCAQVRPWIANVLNLGGPHSAVRRHLSPWPLVRRTVHSGSGMHQIAANPAAFAESQDEYRQLVVRYGRVPW